MGSLVADQAPAEPNPDPDIDIDDVDEVDEVDVTSPVPTTPPSRTGLLEWLALAAAVAPILVTVVRAALVGWMPLFDAGYFAVRSRDVFTEHHPFLGAWSMGSNSVGEQLNNLGPLQLDLLAPFTKIWPYWGTALGVGLVNIASVVGVWLVARRLCGRLGVVGAMLATVAIYASMGSWNLVEARQQLALLLPFWCLLWLTAAMCTGAWWTLPWTVLVSSFIVQTHFSYVYQTLALVMVGTAALVLSWWRQHPRPRVWPTVTVAAAVAAVCWVQTLWEQLFGTGNLAAVLSQGGGSSGAVGWSDGVRYVSYSTLAPPFWAPGYIGEYLRPDVPRSTLAAGLILAAWMAAMIVAVAVGRRHRHPTVVGFGVVGITALAGGVCAAAAIPSTEFGIVAYNYYWMWPIGVFLTITVAAAVFATPSVRSRLPDPAVTLAVLGACVVVAVTVFRPVNYLPETIDEADAGGRVGEPLMNQFGAALDRLDIEGPIVVDRSRETHTNYFPYTMLIELQRRGIEFTFPPGDVNLARFGFERCEVGEAEFRLLIVDGVPAMFPPEGERVLAQVDALEPAAKAELEALSTEFGDLLRDGEVAVDVDGFEFFSQPPSPLLLRVLREPGLSARGLAPYLADWSVFGVVDVPAELDEKFRRWHALEERSIFDRAAIFLAPNLVTTDYCDSVEPGELPAEVPG